MKDTAKAKKGVVAERNLCRKYTLSCPSTRFKFHGVKTTENHLWLLPVACALGISSKATFAQVLCHAFSSTFAKVISMGFLCSNKYLPKALGDAEFGQGKYLGW